MSNELSSPARRSYTSNACQVRLWFNKALNVRQGLTLEKSHIDFGDRCEAKFLTCKISDFTPCAHAQTNVLHIKYADKIDDRGIALGVWCLGNFNLFVYEQTRSS